MILILTEPFDPHCDLIEHQLVSRNLAYKRIHFQQFPERISFTTKLETDGKYSGNIKINNETIESNCIRVVWNRRLQLPVAPKQETEDAQSAIQRECMVGLGALWRMLSSATWISGRSETRAAADKATQLQLAQSLGFQTPPTIFTNDKSSVEAFLRTMGGDGSIVYKPYTSLILRREDNDVDVVYTRRLTRNDLALHADFGEAPGIYQKFIEKVADYRVTVVGSKVFSCRIDSQCTENTRTDVRAGRWNDPPLNHTRTELPDNIERMCIDIVEKLDLKFGAIDIIEDKGGEFYFLEINPNGQWAWIELATGLPIAAALVDLFEIIDTGTIK